MLDETFELFSKYLQTRLLKNVYCTEDSVRYTFFAALLRSTNLNPEDLILEYHPNIPNAEIDTFIPSYDGTGVVMEFKYDRKIPSQKMPRVPRKQASSLTTCHVFSVLMKLEYAYVFLSI